jgi:catalase (peroxidase I)
LFRRSRFGELIERQLDLFEREHADLIREAEEAERAYDRAPRDTAEERYGEYVDLVETGTEALADLRDTFAVTMEDDARERYVAEFRRAVQKRLPRFALEIDLR